MNIYNLEEFKCKQCRKWFHPNTRRPFELVCTHSLCTSCVNKNIHGQNCLKYKSSGNFEPKLNKNVQHALERLLKTVKSQKTFTNTSNYISRLQKRVFSREQQVQQLWGLLDQIYKNQINRIKCLRSRVKQQLLGQKQYFLQLKSISFKNDDDYLLKQSACLQKFIAQMESIDFDELAQQVIQNPQIALAHHYSIFQSKTNKKQNQRFHMIRGHSPIGKCPKNQCQQLSSFKLQFSTQKNDKKILRHRKSNTAIIQIDEPTIITQSTHSFPTRKQMKWPRYITQQSPGNLADLITSLKVEDQLCYSPEPQDELLLSVQAVKLPASINVQTIQKEKDQKLFDKNNKQNILQQPKRTKNVSKFNFLQKYKLQVSPKTKRQIQTKQKHIIDCQKQTNKYIRRMQTVRTSEAVRQTKINGTTFQIFNKDLKQVDLQGYLAHFNWQNILVAKFFGTGLQSKHINTILNCIMNQQVHTLQLVNNELQQDVLDALLNFTDFNSNLKTVSLQRNNFSSLEGQVRAKLALLKQKGIIIYI